MGTSQGTQGNLKFFGNWPDVDLQVLSDFRQYDGRLEGTKPDCVLRLHMDISIDVVDVPRYTDWLMKGEHKKLYDAIIKEHPGDISKVGAKTLKAALGL